MTKLTVVAAVLALSPAAALAGSDYIQGVEQKLQAAGYNPGPVDGEFDDALTAAIRQFQSANGLTADGHLTRETYKKIMGAPASSVPPVIAAPAATPETRYEQPYQQPAAQPGGHTIYLGEGQARERVKNDPRYAEPPPPEPSTAPPPEWQPPVQPPMDEVRPVPPQSRAEPVVPERQSTAQATAAPAQPFKRVGFVLDAGAEFGGDTVATVLFTNGSSQDINSGDGVTLGGGLYLRPAPSPDFDATVTVGYKYMSTKAQNADISVSRVVTKLMGRWWFAPQWWIAGGGVYHSGIKFDAGGLGPDLDFKNAAGVRAELGWRWIGLSYTGIDYTDEFGGKYDASNAGVSLSYYF